MHEKAVSLKRGLSVCPGVKEVCALLQAVWTANGFTAQSFSIQATLPWCLRCQVAGLICWHISYLLTPSRNDAETPWETERAMRSQKVRRRRRRRKQGGTYLTVQSFTVTHSLKCSNTKDQKRPSSLTCFVPCRYLFAVAMTTCLSAFPGCHPLQVWRKKKRKKKGSRWEEGRESTEFPWIDRREKYREKKERQQERWYE